MQAKHPLRGLHGLGSYVLGLSIVAVLSIAVDCTTYAHNPHDPPRGFAVSPEFSRDHTIFVATHRSVQLADTGDVMQSTDGGTTWTRLADGLENRTHISSIGVSPHYGEDGLLFTATRGDGVFEYQRERRSWRPITNGLPTSSPNNETVVDDLRVAASPGGGTVMFAVLATGLYRNVGNQGVYTGWELILSEAQIDVIAVSPGYEQDTTIAVVDVDGDLQISRNAGTTWDDLGQPTGVPVRGIAFAPDYASRGELFLTTRSAGILRSQDFGQSFNSFDSGLPNIALLRVAVSPNYVNDGTVFATTDKSAVYKSTDTGETWTFFDSGAVDTRQARREEEMLGLHLPQDYATKPVVFLAAYDGIFRSDDGGVTWTQKQTRVDETTAIAISPNYVDDRTVVVATYGPGNGVYISDDAGLTWLPMKEGIPTAQYWWFLGVNDIVFAQNEKETQVVAAHNRKWIMHGFLRRTPELSIEWSVMDLPGFPNATWPTVYGHRIAVSPTFAVDQRILLGTRHHGILRSDDGGRNWDISPVPNDRTVRRFALSPNYGSDGTAFATLINGRVGRTTDWGETWQWSLVGPDTHRTRRYTPVALSPNFPLENLVVAGTEFGLYFSQDGGNTWSVSEAEEVGRDRIIEHVLFSPNYSMDGTMFVSVRGRGLYRSSDGGNSWEAIATTQIPKRIQFWEFKASPTFAEDSTLFGTWRTDVYRSDDAGETWTRVDLPLPFSSCGAPVYDQDVDNGLYVWEENCDGATRTISVRVLAGGMPGTVRYEGQVESDQAFTALTGFSIERWDDLQLSATEDRISYTMSLKSPWSDGFDFVVPAGARVCFGADLPAGTELKVGPDAVPVAAPVDIATLEPCAMAPAKSLCGEPVYDQEFDSGLYVWEENCGADTRTFSVRAVAGGIPGVVTYKGQLESDQAFTTVIERSIEERWDDLELSNDQESIVYKMLVKSPWSDGFDFNVPAGSRVCFGADLPSGTELKIGPDAVPVAAPVDLTTLGSCEISP